MSEKITVKGIQKADICEIKISGAFMQRIQGLYFNYVKQIGVDKINEIVPFIKDNTIENIKDETTKIQAFNIETFLILIKEIESSFDKQELIKDIEVDIPDDSTSD